MNLNHSVSCCQPTTVTVTPGRIRVTARPGAAATVTVTPGRRPVMVPGPDRDSDCRHGTSNGCVIYRLRCCFPSLIRSRCCFPSLIRSHLDRATTATLVTAAGHGDGRRSRCRRIVTKNRDRGLNWLQVVLVHWQDYLQGSNPESPRLLYYSPAA